MLLFKYKGEFHMDYMLVVLKIMLGISYAIVIMKLSGKANLAPSSPFDQINNYILGGIVGSVLFNRSISFIEFFFVLTVWAFITLTINFLRKKSQFFKSLIDGNEIDVINKGDIIRSGVEKGRLSIQDLYLKLNLQGIYDIKTVRLAKIQQNGQLLVLTKKDENELPVALVIDKVIYYDKLEYYNLDEQWIHDFLTKHHIKSLDDIAGIEMYQEQARIIYFK